MAKPNSGFSLADYVAQLDAADAETPRQALARLYNGQGGPDATLDWAWKPAEAVKSLPVKAYTAEERAEYERKKS